MADLALKTVGVACAAGSVWFAAHMFTHQEGGPRVNAMEDFAIFAQPNRIHAVEAAVRAAAVEGEGRKNGRAIAIDMTPIGVVSSHRSPKPGPVSRDLRIVEMNGQDALLETAEGYRRVSVGDEIPEIGKIISIRRMGEYWVVVASLRSLAQVAPPPEADLSREGRAYP
jgi:hypothetical protein